MYPQRCFGLARAVPGFHHAQQRRGGKVVNRSVSDKAVKVCAHGRDSHWCQHWQLKRFSSCFRVNVRKRKREGVGVVLFVGVIHDLED